MKESALIMAIQRYCIAVLYTHSHWACIAYSGPLKRWNGRIMVEDETARIEHQVSECPKRTR